MSDASVACILKYLVKGIVPEREDQRALGDDIQELLPHANAVVVLPVVDGYSVEIEVTEMTPFSRTSFEPYVAEHILPEAVRIRCRPSDEVQLQLLKAHYA